MKKYFFLFIFTLLALAACKKQDTRGQYPTDSVPPGEVKSPEVQNVAGGAIITYELPGDEDLLYVEASYIRNGKTIKQKSSGYGNSIEIVGFGRSQPVTVQLVAYDRSGNASKAVEVTAEPL